tara:strand:- start:467 stop:685 length:219 start_codon:yes stop_codon:yes gene_type:complete
MDVREAMEEFVEQMNNEIDHSKGKTIYTDDEGTDHPLSCVEHAGGYNIACYIDGQEVPVGYINVQEEVNEQN